mgnify:CR=1 FL=1
MEEDGEAHLYEGGEEEDEHEVEDHFELVNVAVAGLLNHLADAEHAVGKA